MIHIRPAVSDDAPALLDIYAPYVIETAITFEYEVPTLDDFRQRIKNTLHTHPYLVIERDGVPSLQRIMVMHSSHLFPQHGVSQKKISGSR